MSRRQTVIEQWSNDPWDDTEETDSPQVERNRAHHPKLRWFVYGLGWLAIIGIVAGGIVGLWYVRKINPDGDPGRAETFIITPEDNLETVSRRLQEAEVVSDAALFRWYVRDKGGMELIPGYYSVRPNDHMGNVMRALSTPPSETYTRITFPEGYTLQKMAERVEARHNRLTAAGFLAAATGGEIRSPLLPIEQKSLEGLLFPDTYQVANSETETMLIRRMMGLMERVLTQERVDVKAPQIGLTPYQVLIVASMIEREAKTDVDRPKIARVIYNRLFFKMLLQIDATVYYGRDQFGLDPSLNFAQLRQIDTPYNSYMHLGLPPTPIANPGRASINAALNPAPNPYSGDPICADVPKGQFCGLMYYVLSDEEGNHTFAATLEQHNRNVEKAIADGIL